MEAFRRSTSTRWWILVVIAGAQLMVVLDTTIIVIALPSAQHALGFSNTDRQWVLTAYTLAFGGFLILGGRISDIVGVRRTLIIGVVGFALASAVGGAAQTTAMLIAARGLQGLFGALLAPSVLSLLSTTFTEPHERARAFGIYATIAISGAAFGLILGGQRRFSILFSGGGTTPYLLTTPKGGAAATVSGILALESRRVALDALFTHSPVMVR